MDTIAVLDFGSQTCQLISRRIRDLGIYSVVLPGDEPVPEDIQSDLKGLIFSGSPFSVMEETAPKVHPSVYSLGVPILGICYGLHRLSLDYGGKIKKAEKREYGRSRINFVKGQMEGQAETFLQGVPDGFVSWMSHGDSVSRAAEGFRIIALSEHGIPAALYNPEKSIFGIQFHPEVSHCEYGNKILENFALGICSASKDWNLSDYLEERSEEVRSKVGDSPVLLLISGGVDSTVAAALLLSSLPPSQLHLMYIDTGLMRKGESEEIGDNLRKLGAQNLYLIDARNRFLLALSQVIDPEKKRNIIGDEFIRVQEEEIAKRGISNAFLAQGTLYTDLIESGKGIGKKADVIKSHHNVKSPLVEKKRKAGKIIEPLSMLYKDEVRRLGSMLGVSQEIISRHPFPGPGLAVRILGEVTEEKCRLLQEADYLYINELKKRGLYEKIWQAFCVLLPVKSVGVVGDARGYADVLALRAVCSHDGMTADVYPFLMSDLLEISSLLTNQIAGIGRVVYDVTSKPPGTIEWE